MPILTSTGLSRNSPEGLACTFLSVSSFIVRHGTTDEAGENIKVSDPPSTFSDKDDTQRRVYQQGTAGLKAALEDAARKSET